MTVFLVWTEILDHCECNSGDYLPGVRGMGSAS